MLLLNRGKIEPRLSICPVRNLWLIGLQEGDVGRGQRHGLGDRHDVLQHRGQLTEHGHRFVLLAELLNR